LRFINKLFLVTVWITAVLACLFIASACFAENQALLGDFEDADTVGWSLIGDSRFLSNYSVNVVPDGCKSEFALRLSMKASGGWSGVAVPKWRELPVAVPTAIAVDARGNENSAEICVDISLTDNSRWWYIVNLPKDNSWVHIDAKPEHFFAINNPAGAKLPDLTKLTTVAFTLREAAGLAKSTSTPATMDIDNVFLLGTPVKHSATNSQSFSAKIQSLKGIQVFLADTSKLPALGQDRIAIPEIESTLIQAGAVVHKVNPGELKGLSTKTCTILIWEGPVCTGGDWNNVEAYLKSGGALLWWGGGLPFSRPIVNGKPLEEDLNPVHALCQGDFQTLLPSEAESPLRLTGKGSKIWPGIPSELEALKCRFLTTNDSTALNTHWPWVDFQPLMTVDYMVNNWVWQNSRLTGSVASIFKYHAGKYAGARVFLASLSSGNNSPLSPNNPLFAHMLTGIVADLAKPVKIDQNLTKLPAPAKPLTRSNFFTHPQRVIGGLDWGVPDWSKADYAYGIKRLGLNVMNQGIAWRSEPDANGSVIDWIKMDKLVSEAEAGGWSLIFDGYCFGYGRFAWAVDAGGKTTQPSSIYNPKFTSQFKKAMIELVTRYKNRPSVVAVYATPDTGTMGFNAVDVTDTGREAWEAYAAQHGLPKALPTEPQVGQLDLSPARAAYIEFDAETILGFMRDVIAGIRKAAPEMPILLRGTYIDVALSFRLASEFKNVAPYCECQETSPDVEAYFRGYSERYKVPIAGENGWPKERGGPLRMAFATTLLGNYSAYLFSFTAIPYARPGLHEFEALEKVWPYVKGAKYAASKVGIIIPDSTIWASNPPNFFSAEKRPSIEFFMERTGIPFQAVSAQWPKLDGLKILVDDGRNEIFCAASRQSICSWVKAGGTLIAFPTTGRCDAAGGKTSLASELGISLNPGVTSVGKGSVITLSDVPTDETHPQAKNLVNALNKSGAISPIKVTPYVNQAVFTKGNKTYLVVYNKSRDYVGSFFNEITVPSVESNLPNLSLTITLPKGTMSVRELQTGTILKASQGKIKLPLPATHWRVIEFTR